jgi:predicted cobalt transporter CbtA
MLRNLLICGLIAGVCAGALAAGFATITGEPAIDRAIVYEGAHAGPVSREVQKSAGLLTATVVYGLSLGGLFAIAFAVAYGRVGRATPRATAYGLAAAAFVVVFLVPFLKYPANPPSVGDPDTIGRRTELYLVMVAASLLSALAAVNIRAWMLSRPALRAYATLGGLATYAVVVTVAAVGLPGIHEVPADFPATTLWRFREASIGLQVVLWSTIGLAFGYLAQRVMTRAGAARPEPEGAVVAPGGVERAR